MWHIITEEDQKRHREQAEKMREQAQKDAEEKRKGREAHEATRCPHCGRIDPLPPWLY